jgi:hypothetical protein
MLHMTDIIKKTATKIISHYCCGAYGGPSLAPAQVKTIANALAIELLPAILAEVQGAISKAAMAYATPHVFKIEGDAPCLKRAEPAISNGSRDGTTDDASS